MTQDEFRILITEVTDAIAGRSLDAALAQELNERFPADGKTFQAINQACHDAIAAGWMCDNEHGGIKFGRVVKQGPETAGFSVDVVHMQDVKGPHHRHPNGEIDMIMPITPTAKFDGHGAGWYVYGPDTAHHPTVTEGEALVLYLLPDGAIEFTKGA
ncbi:MAG: DUF4863 family protein [Alphaproteobacteria bacterium]|nr:DUF4863 family protein [Alphaproteobacteria bacterium]